MGVHGMQYKDTLTHLFFLDSCCLFSVSNNLNDGHRLLLFRFLFSVLLLSLSFTYLRSLKTEYRLDFFAEKHEVQNKFFALQVHYSYLGIGIKSKCIWIQLLNADVVK